MSMVICECCDAFFDSDYDPDCFLGAEKHYLVLCEFCREDSEDED